MTTEGAEAVRRTFLSGFIPGVSPPALDPALPEEAWDAVQAEGVAYPRLSLEFWTSRQRQAANLHEISYRACYKPQLPRHFIERLTQPGERVYDPFSGRGTTALEAALLGRRVAANDVNPLARMLAEPRLTPPEPAAVEARLRLIPCQGSGDGLDLGMFFHADTEAEIRGLRDWLLNRSAAGELDDLDTWIRMVATNRLTGHSPGFFSVYTLPPNQALTADKQRQINAQREQVPSYRDTHALILKKTRQLLTGLEPEQRRNLAFAAQDARFLTGDARETASLLDGCMTLTVTSPPFLDVVDYTGDNWLRCWFTGLDAEAIGRGISTPRTVAGWSETMAATFDELHRLTRPGGFVAFEVGEIRKGKLRLDEVVLPLGLRAGFRAHGVLVNRQTFTKTAHIWGVGNNDKGTNSNRVVLFERV
ncbi:MAG: site-specific DNA-methyltransferase [Holophagaceae bacterium]|uniref:Site-specific DNA-methyltransferase n=1 Tax=Candidatus Geothrix skivensis TaxID=2954439 RepID=A0A9D7XN02_9BACT|nr:site-specific DNA-methyltransferase [Candidatus Geothrix skivensis]